MKKTIIASILVSLLALLHPAVTFAHPSPDKCDNAEARAQWAAAQARQIAEKLQLTPELTAKLSKDYLACQEDIWQLNKTYDTGCDEKNVATDSDAEKILKARFEKRRKFNQVQEKYYKKYSSYLTQRQVLRLYKIERRLMEQHFRKERHEQNKAKGNGARKKHSERPVPHKK